MTSHISKKPGGTSDSELREIIRKSLTERRNLNKVLLIPPDMTRMHSGAGRITEIYYEELKDACHVDIMPALGTHEPMSKEECRIFFGNVPYETIIDHNWRKDVIRIGQIPGDFISEVSEGLVDYSVDVEVNRRIMDTSYDLILSIGQVVPHEVVGMANYSKNIFVGCGGSSFINASHFLGAVYGMEQIMGRDYSPVRNILDYAEQHFIKEIPIKYVLTVVTESMGKALMHGMFIGRGQKAI